MRSVTHQVADFLPGVLFLQPFWAWRRGTRTHVLFAAFGQGRSQPRGRLQREVNGLFSTDPLNHKGSAVRRTGAYRDHSIVSPSFPTGNAGMQRCRTAILFDNIGPYHRARLEAAADVCELLAVEFGKSSGEYSWLPTRVEVSMRHDQHARAESRASGSRFP